MRQRPSSFEIVGLPAQPGQHHRTLGAAQERDDLRDFRNAAMLALDLVDARRKLAFGFKQHLVGGPHRGNAVALDAAPSHTDDVDAGKPRSRVEHVSIRYHVFTYRRIAGDHNAFAKTYMLVHGAVPAEKDIVTDLAMPPDHGVVGENNVVADMAIVRHVGPNHQKAGVANGSDPSSTRGAGIDGNALADLAVRADDKPCRLAFVVHGLRRRAEGGERINRRARADGRVAGKVRVRDQLAVIAKRDVRTDYAIGADFDVRADDGARRYACGRIDCQHHASISIAPTSASATTSPLTLASAVYHHMFLRRVFFFRWYSTTS